MRAVLEVMDVIIVKFELCKCERWKAYSCLIYHVKEFFSTVVKNINETELWNWFLDIKGVSCSSRGLFETKKGTESVKDT